MNNKPIELPLEDVQVLHTMRINGGGFVKALAEAGFRADSVNIAKIKAAWPDLWAEYSAWTRARLRKLDSAERGPS
jgi:hypothetical protein